MFTIIQPYQNQLTSHGSSSSPSIQSTISIAANGPIYSTKHPIFSTIRAIQTLYIDIISTISFQTTANLLDIAVDDRIIGDPNGVKVVEPVKKKS